MPSAAGMIHLTQGTLLNGLVHYAQPKTGYYRTGIEPVLLAAAIPAKPNDRILEAGTGAGAALLCLHARQPGLQTIGLEQDPVMAEIARQNAAQNNAPLTIHTASVDTAPQHAPIDHALANPPWHNPASTPSTHRPRARATHQSPTGLAAWITPLAQCLTPQGTLTLALPATLADQAITLLTTAGLTQTTLYPLHPRQLRPPKLIILQARQGPPSHHTAKGLILHRETTGYTEEAEQILRHGAPLTLT